jgi:hypothetical protein
MQKEFINPRDLPNWQQTFSQVVVVNNGSARTIYVAGQVSVDEEKNLIGAGDLKVQAGTSIQKSQSCARSGASDDSGRRQNRHLHQTLSAERCCHCWRSVEKGVSVPELAGEHMVGSRISGGGRVSDRS